MSVSEQRKSHCVRPVVAKDPPLPTLRKGGKRNVAPPNFPPSRRGGPGSIFPGEGVSLIFPPLRRGGQGG